jgi:hypothetical protein
MNRGNYVTVNLDSENAVIQKGFLLWFKSSKYYTHFVTVDSFVISASITSSSHQSKLPLLVLDYQLYNQINIFCILRFLQRLEIWTFLVLDIEAWKKCVNLFSSTESANLNFDLVPTFF